MSLLKRIVGALWTDDPFDTSDVPETPAFGVTPAGQVRLAQLASGQGVIIRRVGEDGPTIDMRVEEGAAHERVTVSGFEPERLAGLLLDYDSQASRWRLATDFSLHARKTPNPRGRLYRLNRRIGDIAPGFFTRATANPSLIQTILERRELLSVLVRAHTLTVTVEEEPGKEAWSAVDAHVDAALKAYLLGAGRLLEGDAPRYQDPFVQEVARVVASDILPTVHRDGGDLRLIDVTDGIAKFAMEGACRGCPSSAVTLQQGVKTALKRRFGDRIVGVEAEAFEQ